MGKVGGNARVELRTGVLRRAARQSISKTPCRRLHRFSLRFEVQQAGSVRTIAAKAAPLDKFVPVRRYVAGVPNGYAFRALWPALSPRGPRGSARSLQKIGLGCARRYGIFACSAGAASHLHGSCVVKVVRNGRDVVPPGGAALPNSPFADGIRRRFPQ